MIRFIEMIKVKVLGGYILWGGIWFKFRHYISLYISKGGRGGWKTPPPLTSEPLDGFSNFKKVNDSIFCQQCSKMIRFIEMIIVKVLGGYILWGGGLYSFNLKLTCSKLSEHVKCIIKASQNFMHTWLNITSNTDNRELHAYLTEYIK